MSSETTNLHLVKPTSADTADIGIINGNMDAIDTAVGALQESVSSIITIRRVTVTINKTVNSNAAISAPAVAGYTFVAWIGCATDGWIAATYIDVAKNANAYVWLAANAGGTSGTGSVQCTALYCKG